MPPTEIVAVSGAYGGSLAVIVTVRRIVVNPVRGMFSVIVASSVVALPENVTGDGLKVALTPAGSPDVDSDTGSGKLGSRLIASGTSAVHAERSTDVEPLTVIPNAGDT